MVDYVKVLREQGVQAVQLVDVSGAYSQAVPAVVFKPLNAIGIGTEATIWTPAAGKKFRLMGGIVSIGTAVGNVSIKDNTAGTTILVIPKTTLDTAIALPMMGNGILSATAGNVLTATGTALATISGFVFGTEE